jgi:hypothetical protein
VRVLAFLLLAAAGLSKEGYQRAKWGMKAGEVTALYAKAIDAGTARKAHPGVFADKGDFVVAETTILKRKAYATFTFDPSGLSDVMVRPDEEKADNCSTIADALEEKYGEAKEKSVDDKPDLYLASYAWQLTETRIEFDCSSIKTRGGLARMKARNPGAVFPDALPADAVRLHYFRHQK